MKLNKLQLKAVESTEPNLVIIAPAGSGKTTTLVSAIKKYKEDNPNNNVVAITFTKKSADDLKYKLQGTSRVSASTIHSWAYQELSILAEKIRKKYPEKAFKIKLLEEDKIKEILGEISTRKRLYNINMFQLYSYTMGNYNIDVLDYMKKIFEGIRVEYIEYKRMRGLYDFTDLPNYLLDKLNDYNENIYDIDALFVDEFQDVDDVQLELFNRVECTKRFYIGDPKQAIYLFRGATSDIENRLDNFKKYILDINYRSYQEIIDFATTCQDMANKNGLSNFINVMESYRSDIKCVRGDGGEVYSINKWGECYEINNYQEQYSYGLLKSFVDKNAMILCRKNKEVRFIKNLGYNNVSTVHQAKGLEYDEVILTDFDMKGEEDINIAYVGMTRAKNRLMVADFNALGRLMENMQSDFVLKSLF